MNEIMVPLLALAIGTGMLMGAFFFGGLWWTVRRGMASRHPGIWFMGSMLLRTGIVTTGFYFLLGLPADGWQNLLASQVGFLMARGVATRFLPAPSFAPRYGMDGLARNGQTHRGQMYGGQKDGGRHAP